MKTGATLQSIQRVFLSPDLGGLNLRDGSREPRPGLGVKGMQRCVMTPKEVLVLLVLLFVILLLVVVLSFLLSLYYYYYHYLCVGLPPSTRALARARSRALARAADRIGSRRSKSPEPQDVGKKACHMFLEHCVMSEQLSTFEQIYLEQLYLIPHMNVSFPSAVCRVPSAVHRASGRRQ